MRHYQRCADAYRDDIPTRAELAAEDRDGVPGLCVTGPAGSALTALLDAVNRTRQNVDNAQH